MLSVIQGLIWAVRLVVFGLRSLQVESKALWKISVNSEKSFILAMLERSLSSF